MRKWLRYTVIGIVLLLIAVVGLLHYATFRFEKQTREYVGLINKLHGTVTYPFNKEQKLPWRMRTGQCDNAQPIIFLHGTPGSFDNFSPYLEDQGLRDSFCLVAYERPGFGLSKASGTVPHLEGQVQYLDNLMSDLKIQKTLLVGHSYGCSIALEYAIQYPGRCSGLVLVASPADPVHERYIFFRRILDLPLISWILPYSIRNSNRELIALKEDLEEQSEQLDKIPVPTLIIHGTDDNLVPYANALFLKDSLINSREVELKTFNKQGHFILWQESGEISRAISSFIKDGSG